MRELDRFQEGLGELYVRVVRSNHLEKVTPWHGLEGREGGRRNSQCKGAKWDSLSRRMKERGREMLQEKTRNLVGHCTLDGMGSRAEN